MKSHRPWLQNPQLTLLQRGPDGRGLAALRFEDVYVAARHSNYCCLRWRFVRIGTAQLNQLQRWALAAHSRSFKSP